MAKKVILLSLVITSIVCLLIYSNILVFDDGRKANSQIQSNFEILNPEIHYDHSDIGTCKIPKINPSEDSAFRIIAADEAGKKLPECLNLNDINQVQFRVDDPSSSLIQLNPNASYWNDLICCYVGFAQAEMVYSDYFPKNPDSKKVRFTTEAVPLAEQCDPISLPITQIPDSIEHIDVQCRNTQNQTTYRDQFLFMRLNSTKEEITESKLRDQDPNRDLLNIIFIGLDSVSLANFQRFMPKTRKYLMETLAAVEFSGRNKISSGTQGNLLPMLTGCKIGRNNENPESFSEDCALIWSRFSELGYRTFRAEDDFGLYKSFYPTLKKGNTGLPESDYDWLKYVHKMKRRNKHFGDQFVYGCFDHQWVQQLILSRIAQVARYFGPNNSNSPYFKFIWTATGTHDVIGYARYLDDPLLNLFTDLKESNLLNNTAIFFLSDHGMLYGSYSTTYAGSIEGRMPFMYTVFPEWFRSKYSVGWNQIQNNAGRLTSPFDIHETLLDLLDIETRLSNKILAERSVKPSKNKGITLFQPIPGNRSCADASIPNEWCICWTKNVIPNPGAHRDVKKIVEFTMEYLNKKLSEYTDCAQLVLDKVVSALQVNSGKMKMENKKSTPKNFEIILKTQPSQALFEVNAILTAKDDINFMGNILRVNAYGNQSSCLHMDEGGSSAGWISSVCYCINPS